MRELQKVLRITPQNLRLNFRRAIRARAIRQHARIAWVRTGAHTTGRQTPCGICRFAITLRMPPQWPRIPRAVTCAG